MKIKMINLLNKIANGEEVPKKIRFRDDIWKFDKCVKDYMNEDSNEYLFANMFGLETESALNCEVEIIEEDKKIKKYDTGLTNGRYTEDSIKIGLDTGATIENIIINMGIEITLVKEKMFEIIDYIMEDK